MHVHSSRCRVTWLVPATTSVPNEGADSRGGATACARYGNVAHGCVRVDLCCVSCVDTRANRTPGTAEGASPSASQWRTKQNGRWAGYISTVDIYVTYDRYERTADRRDRRRPRTRRAPCAHPMHGFAPRAHSAHATECAQREKPMQVAAAPCRRPAASFCSWNVLQSITAARWRWTGCDITGPGEGLQHREMLSRCCL